MREGASQQSHDGRIMRSALVRTQRWAGGRIPSRIIRGISLGVRLTLHICAWTPLIVLLWPARPYAVDLAVHAIPQAVVVLALVGVAGLLVWGVVPSRWALHRRARCFGAEFLLAGGVTLIALVIVWRPAKADPHTLPSHTPSSVRLVVFNTMSVQGMFDPDFWPWLRAQNPDMVCFVQTPGIAGRGRDWVFEQFPVRSFPEPGAAWGVVLLSRLPGERVVPVPFDPQVNPDAKFSHPARRALRLTLPNGQPFLLTAVTPPSPRTKAHWRDALASASRDAALIRSREVGAGLPLIVAGDFNSTPIGRTGRRFAAQAGLRFVSPIFGAGTWPADRPAALRIPIDGACVSPGIHVRRVHVGPQFASDHRPVVIDLVIPAQSRTTTLPSPLPSRE